MLPNKRFSTLTNRQAEILSFIQSYIEESQSSPTISEIQERFSFKSPNAVQEHLKALERKGRIRRNRNQWRGLEIIGLTPEKGGVVRSLTIPVPLVGRVAAGSPILAQQNIEGFISVDRSLVPRKTNLFALHIRGDSMINAGIFNGDIVIAKEQPTAENGDIVVALIGDEATVKRFRRKRNIIILMPENDTMQPIKIARGGNFRILGKVVAALRRIRTS